MSATKSDAINIFTCQENRDYLKTMIPNKALKDDELQSMLNSFSRNYISYTSDTQGMWPIVRHLNRLFLQNADFFPSTRDEYSSAGEAIFMQEEINNELNTMWTTCGEGGSNFSGVPWADSPAGGAELRCPEQPQRIPCQNTRFTQYRNRWMDKGPGAWGKTFKQLGSN